MVVFWSRQPFDSPPGVLMPDRRLLSDQFLPPLGVYPSDAALERARVAARLNVDAQDAVIRSAGVDPLLDVDPDLIASVARSVASLVVVEGQVDVLRAAWDEYWATLPVYAATLEAWS